MKKFQNATVIELPQSNHARCPIWEHEGRFYIKANKPNTEAYRPMIFNGEKYTEVELVGGNWFTK